MSIYNYFYRFCSCKYLINLHTQAQLMKKVENLERLLAEERQKVQAAEKRLQMREETQAQQEEHSKMHSKEMSVIQQEVSNTTRRCRSFNKR